MKWGKRAAGIRESISVRNQATKDQFLHPIHSTAAQLSMLKNKPLQALGGGTKAFKELNADVKNRVDAESRKKKTIKEYRKEINAGESLVGKVYNKLTDADKYQAELMYAQKNK
jgi:hypothetical protein